jgi:hypothetical protein
MFQMIPPDAGHSYFARRALKHHSISRDWLVVTTLAVLSAQTLYGAASVLDKDTCWMAIRRFVRVQLTTERPKDD